MEKTGCSILFIDDNLDILEANRSYFNEHGFEAVVSRSGVEAVKLLRIKVFSCVVLDVSIPGMDGYEVCREIRRWYDMPVIFLSCLDQPEDRVRGLMLGGDVYMTKPYELRELHAQVLACLRRGVGTFTLSSGDYFIDRERRILRNHEHCAILSKKEMALLLTLLDQPGQIVFKEKLCSALWPGEKSDENRLQSLVRNLRRKVEFAAASMGQIENVYGTGYRINKGGCV